MKKWMVLGVLVMLVLLGGGGFWVYGNMGIKKFVDMMRYIETFPVELRIKAKAEFNGGSDGLYTGALMKVGLKNEGVVWVWGKNGPRKYEMDENSVLSYYSMCKNEGLLDKLSKEERVQTSRNIYTSEELLEWKDEVKAGDYAVVMKATEKHGGKFDAKGKRIVIVCTGHGMKDPGIIAESMPTPRLIPAELRALRDILAGCRRAIGFPIFVFFSS